jgi:hypothetical protein
VFISRLYPNCITFFRLQKPKVILSYQLPITLVYLEIDSLYVYKLANTKRFATAFTLLTPACHRRPTVEERVRSAYWSQLTFEGGNAVRILVGDVTSHISRLLPS